MSESNQWTPREFTPEELAAIYAKYEKQFTVQDLLGYINDTEEKIPAEEVMAKAEALLRQIERQKGKGGTEAA